MSIVCKKTLPTDVVTTCAALIIAPPCGTLILKRKEKIDLVILVILMAYSLYPNSSKQVCQVLEWYYSIRQNSN